MQHSRWTKTARIFSHADEGKPNTFTWQSSIGQCNVDQGDATFAPYVWNLQGKILKFADCELRLTSSGLEFWRGTDKLNTLSFNPEYKQGANWRRRTPSVGSLSVEEIENGERLKLSYKLTTSDSETEIFIKAGINHNVHFGTRFKALVAGAEQRVSLEFAELFSNVEERDLQGNLLPVTRMKTDKTTWAWRLDEASDHEIEHGTVTKVHLGRKVYALNEEKVISPDFGPQDIAADADDCSDQGGSLYVGAVYMGLESSSAMSAGFRFTNVTVAQGSDVSAATLKFTSRNLNGTITNVHGQLFGDLDLDGVADSPVWSAGSKPSGITPTTAKTEWDPSVWSIPVEYSVDATAVVDEIVNNGNWASGKNMRLAMLNDGSTNNNYVRVYDYADGSGFANLSITYTAGSTNPEVTVSETLAFAEALD